MKIDRITDDNRKIVAQFIIDNWYDSIMVIKGERVDVTTEDGYCIINENSVEAVVTYRLKNNICEITLLHTVKQRCGIGKMLMHEVIETAKSEGADTVTVVTTNDNIGAIAFYQKIGFDIVNIYRNSMDYVRKIKPTVPIMGENGSPLRHEIEFFVSI